MIIPVKFLRNFAKQLGVDYKTAKSLAERSQSRIVRHSNLMQQRRGFWTGLKAYQLEYKLTHPLFVIMLNFTASSKNAVLSIQA